MEQETVPPEHPATPTTYALLITIVVIIYGLIEQWFASTTKNSTLLPIIDFFSIIIPIIGIYSAIQSTTQKNQDKKNKFFPALMTALTVSLLAALFLSSAIYTYNRFFNQQAKNTTIKTQQEALQKKGAKKEEIDKELRQVKDFYENPVNILSNTLNLAIYYSLLSVIIIAFTTKRPSQSLASQDKPKEKIPKRILYWFLGK
jgi:hypothetical protein